MPDVVIENPTLNSPYSEPKRHFRFTDEGISNEIVEGRRGSAHFIPIAKPRKKGGQLQFQPEQVRAFRDTWSMGIHSYLSYLRDRFILARELLTETGTLFVQIGGQNAHLVRAILDEVFGSANHAATIVFQKTGSTDEALLPQTVDYILAYARDIDRVKYRQLYVERTKGTLALDRYDLVLESDGSLRRVTAEEGAAGEVHGGRRAQLTSLTSARPLGDG